MLQISVLLRDQTLSKKNTFKLARSCSKLIFEDFIPVHDGSPYGFAKLNLDLSGFALKLKSICSHKKISRISKRRALIGEIFTLEKIPIERHHGLGPSRAGFNRIVELSTWISLSLSASHWGNPGNSRAYPHDLKPSRAGTLPIRCKELRRLRNDP